MRLAGWIKWMLLCVAPLAVAPAVALDPDRSIAQYKHTRWTTEEGAPAVIVALAQGPDGYLWIGARDGLYRFDGVAFEHIPPQRRIGDRASVSAVLATRDGSVWAGYGVGGIARFRGGVLGDAGLPHPDSYVIDMVETADGAVWASLGRLERPLARFANGRWEEVGAGWGFPREYVINIKAARDGTLWVTTLGSVMFLKPGSRRFQRIEEAPVGHAALSEDSTGRIWLSDDAGSRAIAGGTVAARLVYPTPGAPRDVHSLFDRDGNLWATAGREGIFRVRSAAALPAASRTGAAASVERFRQSNGLTSDRAGDVFEDREGNIWVASVLGLDRFRAANVVIEPRLTRLPAWGSVLLGASDGSVYIGQADAVYRVIPGGSPEPVLENAGEAQAICEGPDASIWIVQQTRVARLQSGRVTSVPRPLAALGGVMDCAVDRYNNLWVASEDEGLFRWADGRWRHIVVTSQPDRVGSIAVIADRARRLISFLPPDSLSRIDFPQRTDFVPGRRGVLRYLRTIYDGRDGLLLGGRFGLARLQDRRLQLLDPQRVPAFTDVTGVVQTPAGETWLIGKLGIVRLPTSALNRAFADSRQPLAPNILDFRDGLPGIYNREGKRDAVRGGDGRIWFSTSAGTVWVDPARLARNPAAPRVTIGAITVNGIVHRDPANITLPEGTSSGEIDYTALSLSIPERVQFRYRLEGVDTDWVDPGARRQMFFTNLGPGTYRFRVIASNNDGVWNREGDTLEFTIPPTFFQSSWFVLFCLLGLGLLIWLAYSFRVRQLTARVRAGLEARLAERERIARELHDTLLQSFQGLVLRFQAVADRIPADQPLRPVIDQALDRADDALIEGRDRVRDLRVASGDLALALIDVAEECAADTATRFNLTVEGRPRALHPMVSDEVEHIGAEAIRNAFRHGRADEIEAVLTYRQSELRFDLRDDGIGLPAHFAASGGREGHYGLTGMRERAQRIGGTLTISSREKGGTEVALSIPARAAYVASRRHWRLPAFLARWRKG